MDGQLCHASAPDLLGRSDLRDRRPVHAPPRLESRTSTLRVRILKPPAQLAPARAAWKLLLLDLPGVVLQSSHSSDEPTGSLPPTEQGIPPAPSPAEMSHPASLPSATMDSTPTRSNAPNTAFATTTLVPRRTNATNPRTIAPTCIPSTDRVGSSPSATRR